jgi:DNA-binding response OmpR family regulator
LLTSAPPDLVLLDLGLPDVDGTDVLREIHAAGRPPVLVLTARSTVDDRIHGLQLGADDYVTKPFSPAEVVLRVQAVLHRSGGQPGPGGPVTYGKGRLRIDEPRHAASLDGRSLDLTPTEWDLLAAVAAAPERVFSRYELVNRIRGYEYAGYERTIDSHVKNLRHKLGASGADVLETVLGVGYRLRLRRDDPA